MNSLTMATVERRSSRRLRGDSDTEAAVPEVEPEPKASSLSPATALDGKVDEDDDDDDDSDDDTLTIAEDGKDTDDTGETEHSDDDDQSGQLMYNGTMTRRQSKNLQGASNNFAVFTVRSPTKKNRTCEYCGAVKATPAALIRHKRKHTGERPFVCQLCGKAYKAKRSLSLHHNTHHKDAALSLPTQVPLQTPATQSATHPPPSPAVSESTKSLLRSTLAKAKDTATSSSETSSAAESSVPSTTLTTLKQSERLSTPNLVNLLTSDISRKMTSTEADDVALMKATVADSWASSSPQDSVSIVPAYGTNSATVKSEVIDAGVPYGVKSELSEEIAQDLSISGKGKIGSGSSKSSTPVSSSSLSSSGGGTCKGDKKLKCEFCHKSFKQESSLASHVRSVHSIIMQNSTEQQQQQQQQQIQEQQKQQQQQQAKNRYSSPTFTNIEPKTSLTYGTTTIPPNFLLDLVPKTADSIATGNLSIAAQIASGGRYLPDKGAVDVGTTAVAMSAPNLDALAAAAKLDASGGGNAGDIANGRTLEESNTLPYHVTSRMVQDLTEEINSQEAEKMAVLAEDGGQRRYRISVLKESILATRLDGINNVTGRQTTVYKCHLCERVFSSMLRYHHHMPAHFEIEVMTYDCRYCEASFRSHFQILKHLQCHKDRFQGMPMAVPAEEGVKKSKEDSSVLGLSGKPTNGYTASETTDLTGPEPGERVNGGYSCTKCRKSFTREYLLQRHMRIHQNQSSLWCPDCEKGFSGEKDLVEHRRLCHSNTPKVTPEHLKYANLLNSLSSKTVEPVAAKTSTNTSDSNNNTRPNSNGNNAITTNSSSIAGSSLSIGGLGSLAQAKSSVAGFNPLYSMVDMKAIDLRRMQQVAVRMAPANTDDLVARAQLEEFQFKLLLSKQVELLEQQRKEKARTMSGGGSGGVTEEERAELGARFGFDKQHMADTFNSRITQMAQSNQALLKAAAKEEELQRQTALMLIEEKRRKEVKEKEEEKKRKMEQDKLKEELAREGMGDVTVVLPDAPPPDNGSTNEGAEAQPDSSVPPALDFSTGTSRIDNVLGKEYGLASTSNSGSVSGVSSRESPVPSPEATPTKRPAPSSLGSSAGGPPAKSRRKASKPQRINHWDGVQSPTVLDDAKRAQRGEEETGRTSRESTQENKETVPAVNQATMQMTAALSQLHPWPSAASVGVSNWRELAYKHIEAMASAAKVSVNTFLSTPSGAKFAEGLLSGYGITTGIASLIGGHHSTKMGVPLDGSESDGAIDLTKDGLRSRQKGGALTASIKAQGGHMTISGQKINNGALGLSGRKGLSTFSQHQQSQDSDSSSYGGVSSSSSSLPASSSSSLLAKFSAASGFGSGITMAQSVMPGDIAAENLSVNGSVAGVTEKTSSVLTSNSNNNSNSSSKGGSSISPAPSPTPSDASSSTDGKKMTTTSLSRTHSRLSVVNQPVDRNSLSKPKVLEDGRTVYNCDICHKNFLSLSDINRHMDFHEDIRPYKCKYCDYYARTNSQLKVHKLRHEGVREFCCRICHYKGVTQSDLNRHMKSQVHVMRSQNVCEKCGEGFVTPRMLVEHYCNPENKSFTSEGKGDDDEMDEGLMDEDGDYGNMAAADGGSLVDGEVAKKTDEVSTVSVN